jgi:hypothetical protein
MVLVGPVWGQDNKQILYSAVAVAVAVAVAAMAVTLYRILFLPDHAYIPFGYYYVLHMKKNNEEFTYSGFTFSCSTGGPTYTKRDPKN